MTDLDLDAALEARVRSARLDRLAAFSPRTLLWLALLPEWTDELAAAVDLSPAVPLAELLDALDDAGLIERRRALGPGGEPCEAFWVRPSERPGLARYLRGTDVSARSALAPLLAALAPAGDSGQRPELDHWLAVVRGYLRDPSGMRLVNTVDSLLARGRIGEAAATVATAHAVGEVVGPPLSDAARRGRWRLDRAYRTRQDEHHLAGYVHRPEAEQPLADLLDDPHAWALHLLGAAGAGKTMLVRYLASGRFAADRDRAPFPVARADFDHLDPRYPEHRPAEILLALGEELLGFGQTREAGLQWTRFTDVASRLHEELAHGDAGTDPAVVDDLLRQAVHRFARFLDRIGSGPVLLILDTCEELAKLYAPGASAPAIDRTFEVLELLHTASPRVRVVFAGRRWLTRPPAELRAASPRLAERPYLRVVTVPGYTRDEADAFLRARAADVRPDLAAALLHRVGDGAGRYNPFELAAYAQWAASDPDLDPAAIRDAPGDPYVERRIIGRLDGAVRDALPVAAAFGRFDRELITPALTRIGVDADAAFGGLAGQEWMTVLAVGATGQPSVVEIDEHLWERITTALDVDGRVDRHALGLDAKGVIDATPVAEIPVATVEAAVRLLPVDAAAELWRSLEERIVTDRAWAWAAQATARVGAVAAGRAAGEPASLVAAILATQASARLHTGPAHDRGLIWRDVLGSVDRHPDPAQRRILTARAELGLLAAGVRADAPGRDVLDAAPHDAVVAAAEAVLARGSPLPPDLHSWLVETTPTMPGPLQVTALLADAGHEWLGGGSAAWSRTLVEWTWLLAPGPPGSYADWIPPRRLERRRALAGLLLRAEPGDAGPAEPEPPEDLADIDDERLLALHLDLQLRRPGPDLDARERYVPGRVPAAWLHLHTRPLVVALAEAYAMRGEPGHAAKLLTERIREATATAADPDTVDACQLALLRLCRRYRTTMYASSVHQLAERGSPLVRAEAWLVLTLVRGSRPDDPELAGSFYGWWRAQTHDAVVADTAVVIRRHPTWREPEPGIPPAGTAATVRELQYLLRPDETTVTLPPDPARTLYPAALAEALRFTAVDRPGAAPPPEGSDLLVGRAALEAGEVLAIRVPSLGRTLLELARERLTAAGDELGAVQAAVLAMLIRRRGGGQVTDEEIEALPLHLLADPDWGWQERVDLLRDPDSRRRGKASPELDHIRRHWESTSPYPQHWDVDPPTSSGRATLGRSTFGMARPAHPVTAASSGTPGPATTGAPGRDPTTGDPDPLGPTGLPGTSQGPAHGGPAYGGPAYSGPAYGEPAYGGPAYGEPTYGEPAYGEPEPAYSEPNHGAAEPAYGQPAHSSAGPAHGAPVWPTRPDDPGARPAGAGAVRSWWRRTVATLPATVGMYGYRWTALVAVAVAAGVVVLPLVGAAVLVGGIAVGTLLVRRGRFGPSITVAVRRSGFDLAADVYPHAGAAEVDNGLHAAWRYRDGHTDPLARVAGMTPVQEVLDLPRLRHRLAGAGDRLSVVQLEIPAGLESTPWEHLMTLDGAPPALLFRRCPGRFPRLSWPAWWRRRRSATVSLVGVPVAAYEGVLFRRSGPDLTDYGDPRGAPMSDLVGRDTLVAVIQHEETDGPPRTFDDEERRDFVTLAWSAVEAGAAAVVVLPPLPYLLSIEVGILIRRRIAERRVPPRPAHLLHLLDEIRSVIPDRAVASDALLFTRTHD